MILFINQALHLNKINIFFFTKPNTIFICLYYCKSILFFTIGKVPITIRITFFIKNVTNEYDIYENFLTSQLLNFEFKISDDI